MRIISFSKTTDAVRARRKSVTRRTWKDRLGQAIIRDIEAARAKGERGILMQAWTASPHRKGHRFGTIIVTSITKEPVRLIPDSDWDAEGFAFMHEQGLNLDKDTSCEAQWRLWRQHPTLETYVIRFEIVDLLEDVKNA